MAANPPPDELMCITVATGTMGIFGFFLPGVLDVADKDDGRVNVQRTKACLAGLALGVAGSAGTKTPWPFLTSLAMVAVLAWEFEATRKKGAA